MTTDQFFGKYDQKGIDWDGYYGFQCMDLYRQFVKEVFEIPQSPPVRGAVDVWTTYLTEYFDKIDNSPTNCPIKGDIIIWSTGVGSWGHIAICKDGDPTKFTSFDQNWPVGSVCHFQPHNYINVLGWLRRKEPVSPVVDTPVAPPEPPTEVVPEPSIPEPELTPIEDLPTEPDVIPVETKKSFIQVLLNYLNKIWAYVKKK